MATNVTFREQGYSMSVYQANRQTPQHQFTFVSDYWLTRTGLYQFSAQLPAYIVVEADDPDYMSNYAFATQTDTEIGLLKRLDYGQMAFHLVAPSNYDIFVASKDCTVSYLNPECNGVKVIHDNLVIFEQSDQTFLVYVENRKGHTVESDQVGIKVFSPYYSWPVFHLMMPASSELQYWTAFCFDAEKGLKGIEPLPGYASSETPDLR